MTPQEREQGIREAGAYVRGARVELAVLLDADGVEVWRGRGGRRSVGLPLVSCPGGTLLHTHPDAHREDSPLSYADVTALLATDWQEMIAVHANWTHRLQLPFPRRPTIAAEMALEAMSAVGATPAQLHVLARMLGGAYARVPTEAWLAGAGWVAPAAGPALCLAGPC